MVRPVNGYPGVRVPVRQRVPGQWNVRPGIVYVSGRTPVVITSLQ